MIRSKIVRNVAKCLICGETIESTHRYDYRICSCGNLRVDGGTDYIRRGFMNGRESFENLNEFIEEEDSDEEFFRTFSL